jgi:hypothetical protein
MHNHPLTRLTNGAASNHPFFALRGRGSTSGLFAQYARAREVIPVSADRKLVVPSYRIEIGGSSPQSSSAADAALDMLAV